MVLVPKASGCRRAERSADFAHQHEFLTGGAGESDFTSRFASVGNVPQAELIGPLGFAAVELCDSLASGSGRSDQLSSGSEITEDDYDDGDGKTHDGSGINVHDSSRNCLD
jgi:hypothetical protein